MLVRNFALVVLVAAFGVMGCRSTPIGKADLKSEAGKMSYAYGFQIGEDLKAQGLNYDLASVALAIQDGYNGKDSKMSKEAMADARVRAYNKRMSNRQEKQVGDNK